MKILKVEIVVKFYHLMNKDNTMARFHIDGEGLFETVIVDYYYKFHGIIQNGGKLE